MNKDDLDGLLEKLRAYDGRDAMELIDWVSGVMDRTFREGYTKGLQEARLAIGELIEAASVEEYDEGEP